MPIQTSSKSSSQQRSLRVTNAVIKAGGFSFSRVVVLNFVFSIFIKLFKAKVRWLGEDISAKYLFLESRLFFSGSQLFFSGSRLFSRDPDFYLEIPTFFSRFLSRDPDFFLEILFFFSRFFSRDPEFYLEIPTPATLLSINVRKKIV
jgi:hypothetical protein